MLIIDEIINNTHIEIMVDDPFKECWMKISYNKFNVSKEYTYKNCLMLSCDFVNIGYQTAIDILNKNNVPQSHPIWDLNHSDLWQP